MELNVCYWTIEAGKCRYLSLDLCLSILNSLCWANASRNWASLLRYRIYFRKRFLLQTYSGTSCTAETKNLFMGKNLLSIANSTSKCSAQNLGSKVTNRRRGSFPRGQDQRSRFHFCFRTFIVWILQRYWLFTKYFAIFCSQLALWLVNFLPTGPVRVVAL